MSEKEYIHSVGVYISDVRKSKGLTQTECGNAADISRSTISDIEKGCRLPSGKDVVSLCRVLGITPNDIFSCGEFEKSVPELVDSNKEVAENMALLARTVFSFYKLSKQSKGLIGDMIFRLAAAERGHDFVKEAAEIREFVDACFNNEDVQQLIVMFINSFREKEGKEPLETQSLSVIISELVDGFLTGKIIPIDELRK